VGSPTERLQDPATGWLGFFVKVSSIRADRITGIPICRRDFIVGNRKHKLLPHLGEAGTAIFAVKQVEYGGHDRTLA